LDSDETSSSALRTQESGLSFSAVAGQQEFRSDEDEMETKRSSASKPFDKNFHIAKHATNVT
jgi:hypothetical protein